ncbi:hypothetical protein PHJA_001264000 [Phtheirospermum japonicum]|uniref:Uncharacterized protein n=1 Tax=Phtheirospermum japonicum TaxID=374723 RepID=A0A830BUR0_9LAMI|nr:hypothetical protein PHJA_001264000 [Phtheirospermum japonicum]
MLLAYLCVILCFHVAIGQPSTQLSARELDSLLQGYAFRAFVRPRTGIVYDANVPSNLTGVGVAALRLRSGSLRRRGFPGYKEFSIPAGVVEQPYVERLVLVYHNLGNWSSLYYPLPGYTFLTPVLGLLAYDAADLSAVNLPELDVRASGDPISIGFPDVESGPDGPPVCVYFDLDGSVEFNNVVRGNTCEKTNQGHFAIVVQSLVAPSPAPSGGGGGPTTTGGARRGSRVWIIVGSVVGGVALLVLLGLVFGYVRKCRHRKKIRRMEEAAESGVPLPMTSLGYTKAPVATETRTRPVLENEFVP